MDSIIAILVSSCRNWWDLDQWSQSLRCKKLYSRHWKFYWGDFSYVY